MISFWSVGMKQDFLMSDCVWQEAVAKAGAPAAKAGAGAPQGLQKKVVKKDPAGKQPKRGQEAENPHLVEAMKV